MNILFWVQLLSGAALIFVLVAFGWQLWRNHGVISKKNDIRTSLLLSFLASIFFSTTWLA